MSDLLHHPSRSHLIDGRQGNHIAFIYQSALSLFTTPIIYLYLDRLQNRLVRPRK